LAAEYALGGHDIKLRLRSTADAVMIAADRFDQAVFDAQDCQFADHIDHIAEAFFAIIGVPNMTHQQAASWLIRYWLGRIANGTTGPYDGMRRVVDDVYDARSRHGIVLPKDRQCCGDAFGIERLYGLWDTLDELADLAERNGFSPEKTAAIQAQSSSAIIAEAQRWLAAHPPAD
jgi:hypothetical protein